MAESRAAHRYAFALIGIAEELKQFDKVSDDMAMLGRAIDESRDLVRFLKSPVINKAKKRAVLSDLLKGKVTDLTFKFVELITAKEREAILPDIVRAFAVLRDKHLGILRATVRSASPMTSAQRETLQKHLAGITSKNVMLTEIGDPSLMGGFSLQYEDTVWDGSVQHQLQMLREQFESSAA